LMSKWLLLFFADALRVNSCFPVGQAVNSSTFRKLQTEYRAGEAFFYNMKKRSGTVSYINI
jgi:hypothetical protein